MPSDRPGDRVHHVFDFLQRVVDVRAEADAREIAAHGSTGDSMFPIERFEQLTWITRGGLEYDDSAPRYHAGRSRANSRSLVNSARF
jgi:hypothetical protein